MADQNAVTIEFGAKIDQLISGVDQVKSKLGELTAAADSMGAGFNKLKDILITAFSVEGVIRFIESMAELGLSIERNMAILGASSSDIVQVSGMAALAGQSMDSMSLAMNRLSLNVQKATRDGFNPQAQALKLLGINAQSFLAMPFAERMDTLHNAVARFNPSLNLTNVLTEIGGRGFASQVPLLQKNNEEWEAMKKAVDAANEGLAAAAPGMAATHEKLSILGQSVTSLGARIFSVLKPAIDLAITALTNLVQSINEERIRSALTSVIDTTASFMSALVGIAESLSGVFAQVESQIRGVLAPLILLNAITDYLAAALDKAVRMIKGLAGALDDSKKSVVDATTVWDKLRATIEAARTAAQGYISTQGKIAPQESTGKQNMGAINFGAEKGMQDRLKIIENEYKLEADIINKQYGDFVFTEGAKTQALLAALQKRYEAEVAAGEKTDVAYSKFALDRQKILDAANKVYEKSLNDVFSGLQGAINGQLRGMLAGTTSFAQGFKAIIGDMVIWAIQEIEKIAFKWLAHELIMTTATEAGVASRTGTEAAGAAAAEGASLTKALSAIFRSAGETFAGVFAFLSPVMGPAAVGPAAASEATVLGVATGIAGAAVGTDYVARTGLAVIHEGEAVVPAQFNTPFTGGGGSGSTNVNLTVQAIDARSFANFMNANPGLFSTLIKRSMRDGQLNLAPSR